MAKFSITNLPNLYEFNSSLDNLEAAGENTQLLVTENSLGIGACLGYDDLTQLVLSNTDATAQVICTFMALETGTGIIKVMSKGYIRNDSWSLTQGKTVFLSNSTPGLITTTRPITEGDLVQIIGVAISSNTILFDPDKTWLRL